MTILICPHCDTKLKKNSSVYRCASCNSTFSIQDSLIDLRTDASLDTLLDVDTYENVHGITSQYSDQLYAVYNKIFEIYNFDSDGKVLLELASGTGGLSLGLCKSNLFKSVHLSDISINFMNILKSKIKASINTHVEYYLFDANKLPFVDNSFDIILGHSVLHHFNYFENTLKECFRCLNKGGIAVFGEPVLDIHIFESMVCDTILSITSIYEDNFFTDKEICTLQYISNHSKFKADNLYGDRTLSQNFEDKFVFPINYMRSISNKLGFSNFGISNPLKIQNFSHTIENQVSRIFLNQGLDIGKLKKFSYVFDSICNTYQKAMPCSTFPPFSYFVFCK